MADNITIKVYIVIYVLLKILLPLFALPRPIDVKLAK